MVENVEGKIRREFADDGWDKAWGRCLENGEEISWGKCLRGIWGWCGRVFFMFFLEHVWNVQKKFNPAEQRPDLINSAIPAKDKGSRTGLANMVR